MKIIKYDGEWLTSLPEFPWKSYELNEISITALIDSAILLFWETIQNEELITDIRQSTRPVQMDSRNIFNVIFCGLEGASATPAQVVFKGKIINIGFSWRQIPLKNAQRVLEQASTICFSFQDHHTEEGKQLADIFEKTTKTNLEKLKKLAAEKLEQYRTEINSEQVIAFLFWPAMAKIAT